MKPAIKKITRVTAYFFWAVAIASGMGYVVRFEKTPAQPIQALTQWPAQAPLALQQGSMTLLLFVHPQCPCTKATVAELSLLMTKCQEKIHTYIFFLDPALVPADWRPTALWSDTEKIPGVTLLKDTDGESARLFGVTTSGQSLLYDKKGRLLFQGGITSARGQRGDNAGRAAIVSLALDGRSSVDRTPVFGCSLFSARTASQ